MDEERQKKLILVKILVASLAVVIFLFWFFNLSHVLEVNKLRSQEDANAVNWGELKQEISDSLNDVTQKINTQEEQAQLKEDVTGLLNGVMEEVNKTASSSEATSTEIINDATSTIATSSPTDEISSSTLPSKVNNNCPSYINCMPTIGVTKSCQIPAGCEGITQIAY